MEIRFLRGHEVKEVCQIIKRLDNDLKDKDIYQEEYLLSRMKDKRYVLLGAFDKTLQGVIAIEDFQFIPFLYAYDYQTKQQLLRSSQNLVINQISVYVRTQDKDFYEDNGFVKTDQTKNIFDEECTLYVYKWPNCHQFDNYDQVHEFIASQKDRVYALDNFKRFMHDLCNPQVLLKTIHIGGTNGKGSTTNYVRSVLQKEGYKVATFTSPVLVTRLEVMRINNQHILEEEIIAYASRYMDMWLEYELSMFEIEVFIAIMYFLKHHVDFAIFEVGLGGELDATNIVSPIISANTNIGLDHIDYLGDTYEKIARTKGGIIKDYVPFITGEKKQVCLDVFEEICTKHHSPLLKVHPIENVQDTSNQVIFDYRGYHVTLNTSAKYQSENSALAIEILLYLRNNGYACFSDKNLLEGLKQAQWQGRFEMLSQDPLIIIDGAHNKEGIEAFYESAKKYDHIKIIFSALRDKDTHAMLEKLLELTDDVTVCEFDFYRAQSAVRLAESFPVKIEKDWKKAIDEAVLHDGVLFVTGSLYFISQVRPYILEKLS